MQIPKWHKIILLYIISILFGLLFYWLDTEHGRTVFGLYNHADNTKREFSAYLGYGILKGFLLMGAIAIPIVTTSLLIYLKRKERQTPVK